MVDDEFTIEEKEALVAIFRRIIEGDCYDNIKRRMTNPKTEKAHLSEIKDEELLLMIEGLTAVYNARKNKGG